MEYMWAPWRMEYIKAEKPHGCIFCDKPGQNSDRNNLILYRGDSCFVIMNYYPYNNGHLMIVPYRHVARLEHLSDSERYELMDLLSLCSTVLQHCMNPDGFNIGMNLGRVAGAGIDDHIHFHVVPRWNGDTNFMPVVGVTKVSPQGLIESYDQIKKQLDQLTIS